MNVREVIEMLSELNQDYEVVIGDSEYPTCEFDSSSITCNDAEKQYVIY